MTACHPDVGHDPAYAWALWLFKLHDIVTKQTPDGMSDSVLPKKGGEKETSSEDAADGMIAESRMTGGGNVS